MLGTLQSFPMNGMTSFPKSLLLVNRAGVLDRFCCLSCQVLNHPHVYAIADKAHRYMTDPEAGRVTDGALGHRKRDQSIIITGESGAGKTEAAK